MEIRLQKFLADAEIASRRKSEEYILDGRVKVNEKIVTQLGTKINPLEDKVYFDDKLISQKEELIYIMLHKPRGCVTTAKDQFNRKTVLDYIDIDARLYPVGRLDYDTSGLLILTNDGNLTYKLTHPKHNIPKTYIATVEGKPTKEEINAFENGLLIDGYKTAKARLAVIKESDNLAILKITIHEGKNRQVRKMCDAINHPVKGLKRISTGKLELGDLKKGEYRHLSKDEVSYLKNL